MVPLCLVVPDWAVTSKIFTKHMQLFQYLVIKPPNDSGYTCEFPHHEVSNNAIYWRWENAFHLDADNGAAVAADN